MKNIISNKKTASYNDLYILYLVESKKITPIGHLDDLYIIDSDDLDKYKSIAIPTPYTKETRNSDCEYQDYYGSRLAEEFLAFSDLDNPFSLYILSGYLNRGVQSETEENMSVAIDNLEKLFNDIDIHDISFGVRTDDSDALCKLFEAKDNFRIIRNQKIIGYRNGITKVHIIQYSDGLLNKDPCGTLYKCKTCDNWYYLALNEIEKYESMNFRPRTHCLKCINIRQDKLKK